MVYGKLKVWLSGFVLCKYTDEQQITGKHWINELTTQRMQMLPHRWKMSCHSLGPVVPLERRVTANHHEDVLSDHLYPIIKHFFSDRSGLFQGENALIHGTGGITGWFDGYLNDVNHMSYVNEEMSFGDVHPFSRIQTPVESMPRCTQAVLTAHSYPTHYKKHCKLFFPSICFLCAITALQGRMCLAPLCDIHRSATLSTGCVHVGMSSLFHLHSRKITHFSQGALQCEQHKAKTFQMFHLGFLHSYGFIFLSRFGRKLTHICSAYSWAVLAIQKMLVSIFGRREYTVNQIGLSIRVTSGGDSFHSKYYLI